MWSPPEDRSYAYLLGLYLGDGSVAPHLRTARLVITLDGLYPCIIAEAVAAVNLCPTPTGVRDRRTRITRQGRAVVLAGLARGISTMGTGPEAQPAASRSAIGSVRSWTPTPNSSSGD
jgi:hypothetical protein